jgi:hypothetical protein
MADLKSRLETPNPIAQTMAEQFGMKVIITVIDIGAPNEDSPIYDELVKHPPTVDEPVQSSVESVSWEEFVAGMDRLGKRMAEAFAAISPIIRRANDTDR